MPLFHPQNIIQRQFPFPLLHQKTVGIKQKDHGKKTHDPASDTENSVYIISAPQLPDSFIESNG